MTTRKFSFGGKPVLFREVRVFNSKKEAFTVLRKLESEKRAEMRALIGPNQNTNVRALFRCVHVASGKPCWAIYERLDVPMERNIEIGGVVVRVITTETAWHTWTGEAEVNFGPEDRSVLTEMSIAGEQKKEYGSHEEAEQAARLLAERKIKESGRK